MTLATDESIQRFLIHVLPGGFPPIRHYGLLANHVRAGNLAQIRQRLGAEEPAKDPPPITGGRPAERRRQCPLPYVWPCSWSEAGNVRPMNFVPSAMSSERLTRASSRSSWTSTVP